MSQAPLDSPRPTPELPAAGVVRQTVDLVVLLCVGVLLFRTFSAEAYVVPTGSMAPTLMGHHREVTCPNCRFVFVVGIDEEGHTGNAVCPNCGQTNLDDQPAVECNGDRVLVQKFLYDFRRPRRWEVAVFQFPGDLPQAYVKRVVGLPGESVQIMKGDIMIDGRIARKSLQELRAMRILVHDSRFIPLDSDRYPRWVFRKGGPWRPIPSGWTQTAEGFVHASAGPPSDGVEDWLLYRHWDPVLRRYAPIHDHYAYNGGDLHAENVVNDLAIEARLNLSPEVEGLSLMLKSGADRFLVRIPVTMDGEVELWRNRRRLKVNAPANPLATVRNWPHEVKLEASVADRRLIVALDGQPLFEPVDYDDPASGPPADESPFGLGVRGGALTVGELRVFRDVYYTSSLANTPRHPHGIHTPYRLGDDEYFVLGDNSPVSNDSRFWKASPVVPGSMFLGKPFLVHLPGQVVALEVFGRSVYWVPDPRRIRYIH